MRLFVCVIAPKRILQFRCGFFCKKDIIYEIVSVQSFPVVASCWNPGHNISLKFSASEIIQIRRTGDHTPGSDDQG